MRNAIVIITDANLFPAALFLAHRLAALNPRPDTDVLLLTDSQRDIDLAGKVRWPFAVEHVGVALPPGLQIAESEITLAAYYRIFVPRALRSKYRRILYLDCDTYANTLAAFDLFNLDMRGNAVAAVRDFTVCYAIPAMTEVSESVSPGVAPKYLQSGVLLIDCAKYVEEEIDHRVVAVLRDTPRLRFNDQSAFNRVLDGNWLELSPSFNTQPPVWNSFIPQIYPAGIMHFSGTVKPWHGRRFLTRHPVRGEIEQYLAATPWAPFIRMNNLKAEAAPPMREQQLGWNAFDRTGVVSYLKDTVFADVEQGITKRDLSKWPASDQG